MTERFEVYDERGMAVGLESRTRVHREGLLHRAVQVFLFNKSGELLLQLRAADKDLYADRWDASVGEHLIPGERFAEGAVRGIAEELGIRIAVSDLEPIGAPTRLRLSGAGYIDYEEQQLYRAQADGPFSPNDIEVAALRFVGWQALLQELNDAPERFTPWLQQHLSLYSISSDS